MRFDFEAAGETLVAREILRVGEHVHQARPALNSIADRIMDIQRIQFDRQGAGMTGRWERLKPSTVERKARAGLDPRILHGSLKLRKALTERGAPYQQLIVTDTFLVLSAPELEYLKFHQRGTTNMPKRRVFDFTNPQRKSLVKILQRWIMTGEVI